MEELIEELTKVNIDNLSKEGLKLFKTINEIMDKNDELESDLYTANQIISEQIDIINNSVSKDEIKELISEINEDIRISDLKRTNATRTIEMEEPYNVKYSAETVKRRLQNILNKGE